MSPQNVSKANAPLVSVVDSIQAPRLKTSSALSDTDVVANSSADLIHPIPIATSPPPTFPARFDDDGVCSSLCCVLSQYQCLSPSWRNPQTPDEEAFASLKAGMDSLPPGAKMFLNSGV